jgi:hypothetical protein
MDTELRNILSMSDFYNDHKLPKKNKTKTKKIKNPKLNLQNKKQLN